jgi:hypothetical protein
MPLVGDQLDELKSNIAVARKRPLAFGLCLGKSAETTVLLNHKTKDPEAVGRQAKKQGETSKFTFGMMSLEGKNLNLSCHDDPPTGLARKTKEMLKAAGLKLKVRILDAEGNVFEEDGDEEDEEALIAEATEGGGDAAAGAESNEAAEENPERDRWREIAAKLLPRIEALQEGKTPEVKKVLAYWAFALGKAEGEKPDFPAAAKAGEHLEKLLAAFGGGAASTGAQPEAEDAKVAERAARKRKNELDDILTELKLINRMFG